MLRHTVKVCMLLRDHEYYEQRLCSKAGRLQRCEQL